MQGVFKKGGGRFKTKSELKKVIKEGGDILLQATSIVGDEYGGTLSDAIESSFTVVGPDPYKDRNWYARIYRNKKNVWVVK